MSSSILINGEQQELAKECTVTQLLEKLEIHHRALAIEVNEEIVSPEVFDNTTIHPGDAIEIVSFVGGG